MGYDFVLILQYNATLTKEPKPYVIIQTDMISRPLTSTRNVY
jgi:hypothetical protein